MINTLTEQHVVTEHSFKLAKELTDFAESLYLKNVKQAIQRGQLPDSTSPRVLARLLLTIDEGFAIYGITHPDTRGKNQVVRLMLDRLLGPDFDA